MQVPAQEAGVLVKIPVREGQQVADGDLLAQIDDIMPQTQYNVADYKLEGGREAGHRRHRRALRRARPSDVAEAE